MGCWQLRNSQHDNTLERLRIVKKIQLHNNSRFSHKLLDKTSISLFGSELLHYLN